MENIRKQYEKRTRPCVLGTIEEPIEWATLGLGQKVSPSDAAQLLVGLACHESMG
jgi:hypothetical protein